MTTRIVTANLNGIRSAADKGFFEWVAQADIDILGLQEIKAQADTIEGRFDAIESGGRTLRGYCQYAEKKGYSGVALYSAEDPSEVRIGLGVEEFDAEGRLVELRFDRPGRRLSVISAYFPSGSSSEDRQEAKYRFLDAIWPWLQALRAEGGGRELLLMGDVNIAHREIDLKNWKGNLKNSGFLPEERAWMDRLLSSDKGQGGLVDVYRRLHPTEEGEAYTWWSNRGQARANNVGWRIDYQLATPAVAETALTAQVFKAQRFSDHAPLVVDYGLEI